MFLSGVAFAQQETTPTEARLREALRTTTLQLRASDNERITLQTAHDGLLKDKADLQSQAKVLAQKAVEEQDASRKALAALEKRLATLESDKKTLTETVAKWENAHREAAELARSTEAERARLAIRLTDTERLLADREAKNVALFKTGSEILNRLESFGLGDAIKAREPFVGRKRVELQTLVQGYGDQLLDNRVKPGSGLTAVQGESNSSRIQ
ncbi:hypothetical protein AW736_09950 [Termitidicoccus mucosus]|uniref:Uncharacterized protein n=1 Tax=Termitidicoccus mucosus TaxID=1184151 RepID=A0A178IJN6_9BACT|nr:hypothetical protein AW736_09950 [Opitutaceae bacterium TSB47]